MASSVILKAMSIVPVGTGLMYGLQAGYSKGGSLSRGL